MKALTICQPYAHLILLPESDPRWKGVENRNWEMLYRGPLLIHAGKSRQWLDLDRGGDRDRTYGLELRELAFGAIVGIAEVVGCFHAEHTRGRATRQWPWLAEHRHVSGPFCIVLENRRRFAEPIPYRGAQGLFNVPGQVVAAAIKQLGDQR